MPTSQDARAREAGVSPRTLKKLDHLAAHRPDLKAAVEAGRMACDAAYRLAAGKPKPTWLIKRTQALVRALLSGVIRENAS